MVVEHSISDQVFDWIQIAGLGCLICFFIARWAMLHNRGVQVVVVDETRTTTHVLSDLLLMACMLLWGATVFAYAWPLQTLAGSSSLNVVLLDMILIKVLGALAVTAGLLRYVLALRAFGQSWRVGIDRHKPGPLVAQGVFSWTRNPIYVSLELFIFGTFLMEGMMIHLVLALLIVGMTHSLILREEQFLRETYGETYREYCRRVRRYLNWRVVNQRSGDILGLD